MERRDLMRRFILLIDTLYFSHRNVVIEADVHLDHLFMMGKKDSLTADKEKRKAFDTEL
jgi:predicted ATPase